jgi:hypothetical protein
MKPAAMTATIMLGLVALAHLLRILCRLEVTVGGRPIPMWLSGAACVVAGGVALMLWRESRR